MSGTFFLYVYLSMFTTHYDEILLPLLLRISMFEVILSAFFIDAYMILHNSSLRLNIYLKTIIFEIQFSKV